MAFVAEAGRVLEGRYALRSPLGEGGMGTVWRAEHLKLQTQVAVKLVAASIASSTEALARFRREAQVAAALESPHIVRILDFGVADDRPFIAMELLEGETLGARLAREGALSAPAALRIAAHIGRGVARAHQAQVVHCDLKPDNVFLARVDGEEIAKLLDFGIAKAPLLDPLTQSGTVLGTFRYMSPEQLEGRRGVDARSDLYSFAVVVFECICGRPAFAAESIAELVRRICIAELPRPSSIAKVPKAFDAWFLRAANRDPSARFSNAREMVDSLVAAFEKSSASSDIGVASPSRPRVPLELEATVRAPRNEAEARARPASRPPRRGGDERAGFRIAPDRRTRIVEIERWGLWEVELASEFKTQLFEVCNEMKGAPWVGISFATRHPPQKPEVQKLQGETMAAAKSFGIVGAAMVVESALAAMMVRRLTQENQMDIARIFTSEPEARAWLAELGFRG